MTEIAVRAAAPASVALDPRWPIEPLWEVGQASLGENDKLVRGGSLPSELGSRFASRLEIPLRPDRPTVAVNFVSTLDGVVALDRAGATGGREISGASEPDRFLMGLLRSMADAVLVGAGTVRSGRAHAWTPGHVHPSSAAAFARWRRELGLKAYQPTTIVVTASGDLDRDHPGLTRPDVPVIVATTTAGATRLGDLGRRENVEVVALAAGERVPVGALLEHLRDRGYDLVLSEGGPTLFGALLEARAVDELFLTLAPQVAGRSDRITRLGLVEGVGFAPATAPWARLRSVMRSDDHLFLRYGLTDDNHGVNP